MSKKVSMVLVSALLLAVVFLCGCITSDDGATPGVETTPASTVTPAPTAEPAQKVQVKVFHAGSLTSPFEQMEQAFEAKYPEADVLLYAGGSTKIIKEITDLDKDADVLASADYLLIPDLMVPEDADWFATFANNRMVLCYTDESRYADELNADTWYTILQKDDVKWAFSDPNLDPCGYRTPMVIQLAEFYYGDDTIFENTVGANSEMTVAEADGVWTIEATDAEPKGNLQIRPKSVELVQMLESGGIDYAWEYRSVAVQNNLKFIELPVEIDLSSSQHADTYAQVQINCISGVSKGTPIVYGITVPLNAEHPEYGEKFVEMLITQTGNDIMASEGQPPILPAGGYGTIPDGLLPYVEIL